MRLRLSSADHPQTDGQIERVNQCLKNYLRCMAFASPKRWHSLLSQAEWWYNTSFHTSLKMTPFEVLYGMKPPIVVEAMLPDSTTEEARNIIQRRKVAFEAIKANLENGSSRMKFFCR